jgi:hypothetical protein
MTKTDQTPRTRRMFKLKPNKHKSQTIQVSCNQVKGFVCDYV